MLIANKKSQLKHILVSKTCIFLFIVPNVYLNIPQCKRSFTLSIASILFFSSSAFQSQNNEWFCLTVLQKASCVQQVLTLENNDAFYLRSDSGHLSACWLWGFPITYSYFSVLHMYKVCWVEKTKVYGKGSSFLPQKTPILNTDAFYFVTSLCHILRLKKRVWTHHSLNLFKWLPVCSSYIQPALWDPLAFYLVQILGQRIQRGGRGAHEDLEDQAPFKSNIKTRRSTFPHFIFISFYSDFHF